MSKENQIVNMFSTAATCHAHLTINTKIMRAFPLFVGLLFVAVQVAFISGVFLKYSNLHTEIETLHREQNELSYKYLQLASTTTTAQSTPPSKDLLRKPDTTAPPTPPLSLSSPRLAVLVAFRDGCDKSDQGEGRSAQLVQFREHMRQHLHANNPSLDYVIIVAEQEPRGLFNKGALFNAAFLIAMRKFNAEYVVYHDVDQVPTSTGNTYSLPEITPLHLCVNSDQFQAYAGMVGGALMMRTKEVIQVNGFSNLMDGWGLEDDDMYNRIRYQLSRDPARLPLSVGTYHALPHPRVMGLDVNDNFRRKQALYDSKDYKGDGLNTIESRVKFMRTVEETDRYYRFVVDVLSTDGQIQVGC